MAGKETKVASWYWVVNAVLTPFVIGAFLVWAFYAQESRSLMREAERIQSKLRADHEDLDQTRQIAQSLAETTGFMDNTDPFQHTGEVTSQATLPAGDPEQENKGGPDKQNPIYAKMRETERDFYGDGTEPGFVHEYMSARKFLHDFEVRVKKYLAFKATQGYTIKKDPSILRPGSVINNVYRPSDEQMDSAYQSSIIGGGTQEALESYFKDHITLEHVFRRQTQLLTDLVDENKLQYALLVAEVSGSVDGSKQLVGFEGEVARAKAEKENFEQLKSDIDARKDDFTRRIGDVKDGDDDLSAQVDANQQEYDGRRTSKVYALTNLQRQFESQLEQHAKDAEEYAKLLRQMADIKDQIPLAKTSPDGKVSYSDYGRRVCHINLGRSDGIRAGQRFEVWRFNGQGKDVFVGVVEVVRALSAHFSLCTVLELTDKNDHVRKNDSIVSRIWHNGKFLTIALHGTFEPPNQQYSKERLAALLKQRGCRVVDKAQPGTDLVIHGSKLQLDTWYKRAKDDLKLETLREEAVRLYVNPR